MNSTKYIDKEANKTNTKPTDGQKRAGNYKMGHVSVKGFKITIENPKGSYRSGVDEFGKKWKTKMNHHYGYFTLTNGKDGDAVDVFLGPKCGTFKNVYVIDQNNSNGDFDESKVMLGFNGIKSAKKAYLSNYNNESQERRIRKISCVSIENFKAWLYRRRKQRKPFCDYILTKKSLIKESINFKVVLDENTGKKDLVNKHTGKSILKQPIDKIYKFTNGASVVCREGKYNFIDKDGYFILSEWVDDADNFGESGTAAIFENTSIGQVYNKIDLNGNLQDKWRKI